MKRWFCRIISAIDICFFHMLALFLVVYAGLFQTGFMEKECEKNQVSEVLRITEQELQDVIADMISVARGNGDNLDVTVTVDGQKVSFFNEREKQHIMDVSALVKRLKLVGMVGTVLAILCTFYLLKTGKKKLLCKIYLYSWLILLGIIIFTGICMLIDLTGFINTFHRLFFDNNRWILNPAKDRLIWLFPERLFLDAALRLIACLALIHVPVTFVAIIQVRKTGKKNT